MKRRGLLLGLGALFAAPAIVRAASLMPVSVLQPDRFTGLMTAGGFDLESIMVGKQRMFWNGTLWMSAPADMPHWSEALPQRPALTGYVATLNGGPMDRNMQDAIDRVFAEGQVHTLDPIWPATTS